MDIKSTTLKKRLEILYPGRADEIFQEIQKLLDKWVKVNFPSYGKLNHQDVMMITYADAFQKEGELPLRSLKYFADRYLKGSIGAIHLLPMFPFTSDDGFSVTDFRQINPQFGDWETMKELHEEYDLMFDAVINHVSKSSSYFENFLQDKEPFNRFFIVADEKKDYSMVTRPRAFPLLTKVKTEEGEKYVWTTFSDDQIDLNYKEPAVLLEILDILLMYTANGARFIRLDAIGFAWKEENTTCMHLAQTHELIKLMRDVLEECVSGCAIITETNVPHEDNISYFGNGHDEASLVYQFPLPPLTLYSFLTGKADKLTAWASALEPTSADTAYFNFLASHDGIGMRPVEDILSEKERKFMVNSVLERGGQVSYRTMPDGSEVPYELNISYLDGIAGEETDGELRVRKFMASQCILLSVMGMPGIYYHSLLGSGNCYEEFEKSGIKRRINREKLKLSQLEAELADENSQKRKVLDRYCEMIGIRKDHDAFAPNSPQEVLSLDERTFALVRGSNSDRILILVNVSDEEYNLCISFTGRELFTGCMIQKEVRLKPYQYMWICLESQEG